ncbi:MAG: thioredoxin reductase [Bacillota bacterium]|jgi:alkyl hydroperoxide reductase subunit F
MFDLQIQQRLIPSIFETTPLWDLLVIGGGPAGLNAALYTQRKGLKVAVIAKEIGGQLHNTSTVDNYLGIPMIEGKDLSNVFLKHLEALEVPMYLDYWVASIQKSHDVFFVSMDNGTVLKSKTILFATGGQPKKLNIPGEATFANKGVSYCTTCDAPFFKGKNVIVSGGGNSAAEAVLDLAAWAKNITVVHRSQWRADKIILEKFKTIPNLTTFLETQILSIEGKDNMQGVWVLDKTNQAKRYIEADGLFIQIGLIANSSLIQPLTKTNEKAEVWVDDQFMTTMPGLFAAGDVTQHPFKQIVIAVGDGAKAALAIQQYLIHHS